MIPKNDNFKEKIILPQIEKDIFLKATQITKAQRRETVANKLRKKKKL